LKLIIEYYTPKNEHRDKEYLFCIEKNIESKLFDEIHVFIEEGSELPENLSKDINIHLDKRKTFQDLFDYCNTYFPNEICIISNTDIIFDDTVNYINDNNIEDRFLCLTRWDVLQDGNMRFFDNQSGIAYFSQDSWIFKTPIPIIDADFFMGKPGCDNKLAYIASQAKMDVRNPSKAIITKHIHTSNYRTYTSCSKDTVPSPWMGIEPTNNINRESQKRMLK